MGHMRHWVEETGRLKSLHSRQLEQRPNYKDLARHNQELEEKNRALTTELQVAGQELDELKAMWAKTRRKLTVFTEEQWKERIKWAAQGEQVEERRRERLDLELQTNARLEDYDRLALENQELRRQLEVMETSATPANKGLAQHLLSTTKKQVCEELKAYTKDQERYNRYLMRFADAFPTFVYWSDDE